MQYFTVFDKHLGYAYPAASAGPSRCETGGRKESARDGLSHSKPRDSDMPGIPLDQHLDWSGMSEEVVGAGGCTVGAGLKHDDQIAWLGIRELHAVCEQVEGGA